MRRLTTSLLATALLAAPALAQGLPGGATSLAEQHGDWRVTCAIDPASAAPRCTASQTQYGGEKGQQRVLAIEIGTTGVDRRTTGVLVLPFGLGLDAGVHLAVDDKGGIDARFSTCVPAGCLVPLAVDDEFLSALRSGTLLNLVAKANQTGEEVKFTVSLAGLTSALARIADLEDTRG